MEFVIVLNFPHKILDRSPKTLITQAQTKRDRFPHQFFNQSRGDRFFEVNSGFIGQSPNYQFLGSKSGLFKIETASPAWAKTNKP